MKKSLWIALILCCLLLTACRPEPVEESFVPSASQNNAEQTEQKQPEPSVDESSVEKETLAEKEDETSVDQKQPSESETPDKVAEETTQKNGKSTIAIMGTPVRMSQEELTKEAELILHGRVKAKTGELMLNPDGKRTDAAGQPVANAQITSYEVEVYTVYKGAYEKDTIIVKTKNGRDLSPDLILYGESETCKLAEPLERFDLTAGEECILYLCYYEDAVPEESGYYSVAGDTGCFRKEGDVYKNNGALPLTNTLEALEKEHLNGAAQN